MTGAQEWLDENYPAPNENYPAPERGKLKELFVSEKAHKIRIINNEFKGKVLAGNLKLTYFTKLEKLLCGMNKITSLDLGECTELKVLSCCNNDLVKLKLNTDGELNNSSCKKISELYCNNNKLSKFDFMDFIDPRELKVLDLSNNKFPREDLVIFRKFVNLEVLYLTNNNFHGSLNSLVNMKNLKLLDITCNKEINSGFKNLLKENHQLKIICENDHPLSQPIKDYYRENKESNSTHVISQKLGLMTSAETYSKSKLKYEELKLHEIASSNVSDKNEPEVQIYEAFLVKEYVKYVGKDEKELLDFSKITKLLAREKKTKDYVHISQLAQVSISESGDEHTNNNFATTFKMIVANSANLGIGKELKIMKEICIEYLKELRANESFKKSGENKDNTEDYLSFTNVKKIDEYEIIIYLEGKTIEEWYKKAKTENVNFKVTVNEFFSKNRSKVYGGTEIFDKSRASILNPIKLLNTIKSPF